MYTMIQAPQDEENHKNRWNIAIRYTLCLTGFSNVLFSLNTDKLDKSHQNWINLV